MYALHVSAAWSGPVHVTIKYNSLRHRFSHHLVHFDLSNCCDLTNVTIIVLMISFSTVEPIFLPY